MEEPTAAEPTTTDEAAMETSSTEAPTTVDRHTQTRPGDVAVPKLTRRKKIKDMDLITLDKLAFRFKKNLQIRAGENIHGPSGSATRAKNRHVTESVNNVDTKDLNPEQRVLVLREASVHPDARLHFKSAGLIDPDEFEALKFMMSQSDKFLEKALSTNSGKGHAVSYTHLRAHETS